MSTFGRVLMATAALTAASTASFAVIVTGSQTVNGTVPQFVLGDNVDPQVRQFNPTAVRAAIQAGLPAGSTASLPTLTSINFSLTATLSVSVQIANGGTGPQTIGTISGYPGNNLDPTSGYAIEADGFVTLSDLFTNVVTAYPTYFVRTNATANISGVTRNVLRVQRGPTTFTGGASNTQTFQYTSDDFATTPGLANSYIGFDYAPLLLSLDGLVTLGSPRPTNVTNSGSTFTVTGGSLAVTYNYSYDLTSAPVPEPTTLALLAPVVVGLTARIRRKR